MNCPDCRIELEEKPARIPLHHILTRKKHPTKTKVGYVYSCPKCRKLFVVTTMLKEVSEDEIKAI